MTNRSRISRLNHNVLRNTIHFDASTLFERLQSGVDKVEIKEELSCLESEWNRFASSISPLLENFISDSGPQASLCHLFADFNSEDAEWFLSHAQSAWLRRHYIEKQLANINHCILSVSTVIHSIKSCQTLTADCSNLSRLDSLLTELTQALSKLPAEESV
jgi:hypothetical protein